MSKAEFHSMIGAALLGLAVPAHAQVGHDMGSHDMAGHAMQAPSAGKPLREAQTAEGAAKAPPSAHGDHAATGHNHDDSTVPKVPTLLTGYGNGGFAVTTAVPAAQAFFSNGMELGAAFAHKAAIAAMGEAVRLDPACAMCLWGQALVSGPTINYGSEPKERAPLLIMARKAKVLAAKTGTARERDLIDALILRYLPGNPHSSTHPPTHQHPLSLTHLLEPVLEHHHEKPQNHLSRAMPKAPQRAQQGRLQLAAPDGEGGEGRQVVCPRQRVQAAGRQARPRAADGIA